MKRSLKTKIACVLSLVLSMGLAACNNSEAPEDDSKALELLDFVVSVEESRDPIVLQLTDPQFIDNSGVDQSEEKCYQYMRETIEATDPDLILMTGDLIYGATDPDGSSLLGLIDFMEGFEIPWAPVFGNHDAECAMGADWMCEQLEEAENCLFLQRELSGNGNYTVGIEQGGELKRVFFMVDSNGTSMASTASLENGHTITGMGIQRDQVDWFMSVGAGILAEAPEAKVSFAYHIPQAVFVQAYAKYGFTNSGTKKNPINIDFVENKADGDFGYIGQDIAVWDGGNVVWNIMKPLGVDSVFVGHEHCVSASVVYEGVRFQFGQKSSTYDTHNVVDSEGNISSNIAGTPLIGGSVLTLSKTDGSIQDGYIYLCENAGGNIDWEAFNK